MGFKKETLILRDKDWLNHQFIVEKKTATAIARSIGCEKTTVLRWLARHGIKMPKKKHGMRNDRIYQTWIDMKRRCDNQNRESYAFYGGRGIKVCERWKVFENFYADMGDPPDGMSIERNDVNGDYEPNNCRWASSQEQSLNTTRSRFVTVEGIRMNVTTASRIYGMPKNVIKWRLDRGWSDEDAVMRPVRKRQAYKGVDRK